MSRSVRDLRELICASRLSYRGENDNEDLASTSSDDLEECDIPREVSPPKLPKRKKDLYPIKKTGRPLSPPLSSGSSGTVSPLPLPPIRPGSRSSSSCDSEREMEYAQNEHLATGQKQVPGSRRRNKKTTRTNFDSMLEYADSTVIGDWLSRASTGVNDLTSWLHAGSNFVQFAHFWLSEIPKSQRCELVEVEASIIRDELSFAFGPGLASKNVSQEDIASFLSAVLWEFPTKFSGSECGPFFLNILICLCSGRKDSYKSLLSDVKCGTEKKQFAQLILATRAFVVVNVCAGVVGFFKRISESKGLDSYIPSRDIKDVATEFAFDAICKGFVDVLEYLMLSFGVDPQNAKSRNGKSLMFAAVVSGQEGVVRHLLQVEPKLNVNEVSSSGNSALHAAVNSGNTNVVEMLINAGANLNTWNADCDGATPLHMAVMSGNSEMVSLMLKAGCDRSVLMGIPATVTPLKLAEDLGLEDIVELLLKSTLGD